MSRYHLRLLLLGLGVVFGYGSAIAHFGHHHGHHHFRKHCDEHSPESRS